MPARGKAIVPTDLAIKLPLGTYGRVAPRSGLAVKNFIDTGAGVIDADYRGPVGVVLFNHSEVDFKGQLPTDTLLCTTLLCTNLYLVLLECFTLYHCPCCLQ